MGEDGVKMGGSYYNKIKKKRIYILMSNKLLFNAIIKIIENANFTLDKGDIINLEKEYTHLFYSGVSYKKSKKYFSVELLKYSLYFFNEYYSRVKKIYVDDILENFLVCLLISSKFIEDDCLENDILCTIFDLNIKKVNKMEFKIINMLDYNLFVENHNITNFIKEIQRK
jgi:hypothetical protein